ncbi:hypothetical protein GF314_07790 [bacterium]|nr:hypothetical protein [bacterium]
MLGWIEHAAMAIGLVLVLWAMIWKSRRLRGRRASYLGDEGFVDRTVTRAHVVSWVATFVLVALLKVLVPDDTTLPTGFFLQLVLAVMLLVHGTVFFVLNRPDGDSSGDVDRA